MRLRSPLRGMAVAAALLLPGLALAEGTAPPPHVPLQKNIGQTSRPQVVPSLIVMNSDGATLADGKLTLTGVSTNSIVFADRPVRAAGHAPTSVLIEEWADGSDSFAADPPNATVSVFGESTDQVYDAVVVLKSPKMDGANLVFDVDVLEGDITGCFDNISHDWLLANVPMDKATLRKWLKSGYVWKNNLFSTDAGTPQGGIISPVLANMTLDGLEQELTNTFPPKSRKAFKVNLVRYADDFIITGTNPEVLKQAKAMTEQFLKERGLALSPEKTKMVNISEGFDILGWNFRKYGDKLLTMRSKKNVKNFLTEIRRTIENNKMATQENLIRLLNPKIRGWAEYHKNQVSKETFSDVDHAIWKKLWQWAKRRHPTKPRKWVKNNYWPSRNGKDWIFGTEVLDKKGNKVWLDLFKASSVPIRRHTKVKAQANPYDPQWETYFEERFQRHFEQEYHGNRVKYLYHLQGGKCRICGQKLTRQEKWHVHHIVWRVNGGTDDSRNLALLHADCHMQLHSRANRGLPVALKSDFVEA